MGQKRAAYDATGAIIGFYDDSISPAPSRATTIALTDAQWQACVADQRYTVVNGALVAPPVALPPTDAQLLAAAQAAQVTLLSASCAAAIVAGFPSLALGSAHTYPSKSTDQQNLSASIIAALLAANSATGWAANTVYEGGEIVNAGGQLMTCVAPGTSGAAAPAWPTAVGEIANDNGVQWQIWTTPFWCEDASGNWAWVNHTSAQIQKVGVDGKAAILANMAKNAGLAAQVAAATTVAAVQEIVWS
jgi:hypothetical protein